MPTYEYACKSCGERLEVQQRFTDDALTECPACQGQLRKVFGSVGIAFKGSGFYKNDARGTKSSSSSTSSESGSSSTSSETKSTSSETKSSGDSSSSTTSSSTATTST